MADSAQQRWDVLSKAKKDELLRQYRDIEVRADVWSEDVQEAFVEQMKAVGINVDQIYYTGFWSQGDGACFKGDVESWPLFLAAAGYEALSKIRLDGAYLSWTHSGHYYHEYCTSFETGGLYLVNPFDEEDEPLRHITWNASYGEDGPLLALEKEFIEFIRSKMRELYRQLEERYDELTSDESVLSYILECVEDFDDFGEEDETTDEETLPLV
jgi:hypothetical protein